MAKKAADYLNNSKAGKKTEQFIETGPYSKVYWDKTLGLNGPKAPDTPEQEAKKAANTERVKAAIKAVQGVVRPAYDTGVQTAPGRLASEAVHVSTGNPRAMTSGESMKYAKQSEQEAQQTRMIEALKHQQELARINALRQRLTSGN